MSETVEANSGDEKAPKKGKGKLLMIIGLVVVLAGGGGGGYFYWSKAKAAAVEEGGDESAKSENSKPKKAKKAAKEDGDETQSKDSSGKDVLPADEDVKEVVELAPFIVNLSDDESPRYLRLSVSVGIGEGHEKPTPLFMTRVKNAMLLVLAGKTSEEILSVEGKAKLRKELLKAAQAASEEPHVEAIYITDFIVQL
jgi:flagellar protein FliL